MSTPYEIYELSNGYKIVVNVTTSATEIWVGTWEQAMDFVIKLMHDQAQLAE